MRKYALPLLLQLLLGCGSGFTTTHPMAPVTPTKVIDLGGPTGLVYEDPEGLFSIAFPAPFVVDQAKEALGTGTMQTTSISTTGDDPLFMAVKVALVDIPNYDCQKALDGMRDETMNRVGCSAVAEKRSEIEGSGAREITFTCPKRRGLMLLACDPSKSAAKRFTAYEIAASGSQLSDDAAHTFLNSFTVQKHSPSSQPAR